MRKEIIWAIILGLFIGGIILYGIKVANQSIEQKPEDATTQITPTPTTTNTSNLTINSPQDHSVSFDPSTILSGNTFPNGLLAIISESDDQIATADATGKFSLPIKLIPGENIIDITSVNPSDQSQTTTTSVTIIYTTAKID